MTLFRNGNAEDQRVLVDHEETEDMGAGGFLDDAQFSVAPLPEPSSQQYDSHNPHTDLQTQRQLEPMNVPPDRCTFTYLIFYLLGVATMTPWNFFVTAEDYWMYKFRNTTLNDSGVMANELTPMQKSFTCDLTLTASISGTTFLILNAIYGQHVSLRIKMIGTLTTVLAIFVVTTAFVEVDTDHWQEQFFLITLFTVVIINICSAVMSGAIFGIAGLFPSEFMTALVSGQALGGIFTALTFILVLAFGAPPNVTAFVFFTIGSLLILLSIVTYAMMSRMPFFKFYVESDPKYEALAATAAAATAPSNSRAIHSAGLPLEANLRIVFGKIYVEAVSVCILFATTLAVYPGVTVLMQSEDFGSGSAWSDVYYLPVVNYLFFNSGDYFGRLLAGVWERPRKNAHTVLLMVLLRVIYVPFFLCSNTNLHQFLPTLVQSDISFITLIITFALTNGYLANITLIMAPRCVLQNEKELASSIMAASLSLGLALGSVLSMIFVQIL